jgi:two-component system, OmpR family, phosphate regulon sensor histidine kinase PhoR
VTRTSSVVTLLVVLNSLLVLLLLTQLRESTQAALWGALILAGSAAGGSIRAWMLENRLEKAIEHVAGALEHASEPSLSPSLNRSFMELRLAPLYRTLARVQRKHADHLRELDFETELQRAILETLAEGVMVVDSSARVTRINRAARRFVTSELAEQDSELLDNCIINDSLKEFIHRVVRESTPQEDEIAHVSGVKLSHWNVYGRPLEGEDSQLRRSVIVLRDVSRIRRLETIRRDFVANVSHELKTPVTSISACVETLLDGALGEPEDSRTFVTMIGRQAERLNLIFDDLLTLSRLEQSDEEGRIHRAPCLLDDIPLVVEELCRAKAEQQGTSLQVVCHSREAPPLNRTLVQQAVVNLVDNAIKYSKQGSSVHVDITTNEKYVTIVVSDNGIGISEAHLKRLFERFYRVDPGRARREGGTGLGLAIVKHIAQVHGGTVSVVSKEGEGSIFTLELPFVKV